MLLCTVKSFLCCRKVKYKIALFKICTLFIKFCSKRRSKSKNLKISAAVLIRGFTVNFKQAGSVFIKLNRHQVMDIEVVFRVYRKRL